MSQMAGGKDVSSRYTYKLERSRRWSGNVFQSLGAAALKAAAVE